MNKIKLKIIDKEVNRGVKIKEEIIRLGYSAEHFLYVWGNENKSNPICNSDSFVSVDEINFVHTNNVCSEEFIDFIISTFQHSWVVEYSGGGKEEMGNRLPKSPKHILYPNKVQNDGRIDNLEDYLNAVVDNKDNACDILLGFDPTLEAKLELLHACLTLEGAKNIVNSGFSQNLEKEKEKFWNKKLEELNPSLFNKGNNDKEKYAVYKDWTVEEIVKALSSDNTTDKKIEFSHCFAPEYLAALSALRNSLLAN